MSSIKVEAVTSAVLPSTSSSTSSSSATPHSLPHASSSSLPVHLESDFQAVDAILDPNLLQLLQSLKKVNGSLKVCVCLD